MLKTLALVLKSNIGIIRPDPTVNKGCMSRQQSNAGLSRHNVHKNALEELGYRNCIHPAKPLCQFSNLHLSVKIVNTKITALQRQKISRLLQGHGAIFETRSSLAKIMARVWTRSDHPRWIGYWVSGVISANDMCRRWMQRQRPNLSLYSNGAGHLRYYKRVAMAPGIALWSIVSALSFFGVFALYSVQLVPQLLHVDVN
ncbi:uncharacterized protein EURHEDRAFT_517274 [Aspergillus ruber CBS 135680]|uniref:Uncharacterized protein n=1 Tax=Aspergillus ruber (strain CBS 135680) TaxID=1388766 RepID=A0A017S7G4_ASPRC|nr:uncharacterized protein EURHEDRAFT_517274 [Aspergillus ruber CBS 135680]EYE92983.1 hypothetical protein EURHEDRAFT_517274 [Aspergillus ruber CBS 135680]